MKTDTSGSFHIQKRVRISFLIQVRPFVYSKSHVKVKAGRLEVLLIDGNFPYIVMMDPIFQKLSAQSITSFSGREVKHLQTISGYPHKGDGLPGFFFGNDEMFYIVQC